MVAVIRESSAPCRFFDSDVLVTQPIEKQADGIHPTMSGGAVWAAAFWEWLGEQRSREVVLGPRGRVKAWALTSAPEAEHRPFDPLTEGPPTPPAAPTRSPHARRP